MVVKLTLKKSARGVFLDKDIAQAVEDLPNGTYDVYIAEVGYKTTAPHRRLFWMWMACLEYETGQSRMDFHDYFVKKYIPPYKHGISDISTKAMTHFMEQIKADAQTDFHVMLPLPSDLGYNEFILDYKYR